MTSAPSQTQPTNPVEPPTGTLTSEPGPRVRRWTPRRVLVTRAAVGLPHTEEILRRVAAAGVEDVETVGRVSPPRGTSEREAYAWAKTTLAVVVAPPSALKPQPIPPSADWRIDLAKGCPAHCQYCYLAGSLTGPPVTRVYANLDDVLAPIPGLVGHGTVTSGTAERGHEGTTFELSCYTDPLGIEHVTGSLAAAVERVGTGVYGDGASLRFTTKFDDVAELAALPHGGRTRARFSVNAEEVAARFDGGTAPVAGRLRALATLAAAGYPVGLTVAPVMPVEGWQDAYGQLLDDVRDALAPVAASGRAVDLTVEVITHRFTPGSRDVLMSWYPRTRLEMDVGARRAKRSKFGGVKYVYPTETMRALRAWFETEVPARLPGTPLLYLT
ncbi:spore photoproduct lyase [Microlunatus sagamiharensis]|uniref:Spore photoproduct lyase n=1 Tax=Microlunatus sagamiharensis TaxID=546874 RepID=A0A1H2M8Y8_9ACTN|nr:radical SAM protein [Microlunatus sagamiharensis]SDU89582.1 spore photoproduct lyase [Microlunatus sagamiharensis]